jgi:pilus assembly protein Flp/PilA
MKSLFNRYVREDQGQDLIEYALLAAFVSLAAVAGATLLGGGLNTWYTTIGGNIKSMDATP